MFILTRLETCFGWTPIEEGMCVFVVVEKHPVASFKKLWDHFLGPT